MTDHHPLKYLDTQKNVSRRQARWVEFMQEIDCEISYLKGKSNIVADALSRQYNEIHRKSAEFIRHLKHITTVNIGDNLLKKISGEYERDSFFTDIFKKPTEPYKRMGYRLYLNDKLCIPRGNIKKTILNDKHESLLGAHRSYKKTLSLISRYFYLPNMKKELKEYVESCQRSQEAKSRNQKQLGLLRPFPPPAQKWEEIAMDFIFELPRTKDNKTGIMVVVDKLSKGTHFIPIESKHNAERTAATFYKEIYKHHGLPRKIVSDRDSRFTGNFSIELMKLLNVKLNLSTAFHPQTDGQSERAFRTLEEMLRCFVSNTQKDWSRFLPGLEFAYNNHMNETTNHTPLFLEYGQHPLSISDILHSDPPESTCPATANFLSNIRTATCTNSNSGS